MSFENPDNNALVEEARQMAEDGDPAQMRVRGKTKYLRRAIVRLFNKSTEERAVHVAKDGWEEAAVALFKAVSSGKSYSVQAFRTLQGILGEYTAPGQAHEDKRPSVQILDDLPRAHRTRSN